MCVVLLRILVRRGCYSAGAVLGRPAPIPAEDAAGLLAGGVSAGPCAASSASPDGRRFEFTPPWGSK
jgi:hypothetical protein